MRMEMQAAIGRIGWAFRMLPGNVWALCKQRKGKREPCDVSWGGEKIYRMGIFERLGSSGLERADDG